MQIIPIKRAHAKLLSAAVLFCAWGLLAFWIYGKEDAAKREELLLQIRPVARAVNVANVRQLAGDPSDHLRPAFRRLIDQLAAVRAVDDRYRYLYLMGMRAESGASLPRLVFLADVQNELNEDDSASQPGDPYDEATDELLRLFEGGEAFVEGPVTDEWGNWVSALVPIKDPGSGEVLAVMGCDIEAGSWRLQVAGRTAFPVGLLTLATLLTQALLSLRLNQQRLLEQRRGLEEGERRFQAIAANSRSIAWEVDEHGIFTFVSNNVKDVLGFQMETILRNWHLADLAVAGAMPDYRQLIRNHLAERQPFSFLEVSAQCADGSRLWLSVNGDPFLGEQGRLKGFRGSCTDVTERHENEDALLYQAGFQDLLMQMAATYIDLPTERVDAAIQGSLADLGRFVQADRVYIFEYCFDQGTCRNTFEWCADGIEPQIGNLQAVPLDQMPEFVDSHRRGRTWLLPDVRSLPQGHGLRSILERQSIQSMIAVPMVDGPDCLGFVGFDSVVNPHQYSHEEQRLLWIFSQMLVNIRNRRQLEQALVENRLRAEQANIAKSEFLANVSHEIRTPMNGVIGMTALLLDSELSESQREQAEIILNSSEALMVIINDILDFSQLEAGKLEVRPVRFELKPLLDELISMFELRARQKGLVISGEFADGLPRLVEGDPVRIRQVLTNLVGNAIKFTDSGGVSIRVEQHGEPTARQPADSPMEPSPTLLFTIRDTGIGISAEQQYRLFERFSQVDASSTRRYGGTGLGLAISKQLVYLMGGMIGFSSEPGKGSEFWFRLPLKAMDSRSGN